MESIDIKIKTATLEIKVLTVNKHKMTISVFNQIIDSSPFCIDKNCNTIFRENVEILGFVERDVTYLLWTLNGKLLKKRFSPGAKKLSEYFKNENELEKYRGDFYYMSLHNKINELQSYYSRVMNFAINLNHFYDSKYLDDIEYTEITYKMVQKTFYKKELAYFSDQLIQFYLGLHDKYDQLFIAI